MEPALNLTLHQLKHFMLVAEELHFRRAAEIGNVAQPVLSRSIKTLEKELGFDLFNRHNRNVELTEAGRAFLASAQSTVGALDSGIRNARRVQQTDSSCIRIGYSQIAFSDEALPRIFNAFEKNNSNLKLETECFGSNDILEQLHHGELDFGFLIKSNHLNELNSTPFQEFRYTILVRDDHYLAATKQITLEQLQKEKLLLTGLPEHEIYTQQVLSIFRSNGYEMNIEFVSQLPQNIIDSVVLGKGVAIVVNNISLPNSRRTSILELKGVEERLHTVMAWKGDQHYEANNQFHRFVLESIPE